MVERVASRQNGRILFDMALFGAHMVDPAVPVLHVVPVHETLRPSPCGIKISKAFNRKLRSVLMAGFCNTACRYSSINWMSQREL